MPNTDTILKSAPQSDDWDIFMSYSHRDLSADMVAALRQELEYGFRERFDRSLNVFLDRSDIRTFDDWIVRCYRALRHSRFLLVCVSPGYFESDACRWEWEEWLKRELERGQVNSAAACVWLVELPNLRTQPVNDLASQWIQELWQRPSVSLHNYCESWLAERVNESSRATLRGLAEHIAQRFHLFSLTQKQLGNMRLPNEYFVGRSRELSRIAELLSAASPSAIAGLVGISGIGKSALALRYSFVHASEYPGGRWLLQAKGHDTITAVIRSLNFDLQIEFSESEKKNDLLATNRILSELHQRGRALLVLDDVDIPLLLADSQTTLLPSDNTLRVLFTTRLSPDAFSALPAGSAVLPVDKLLESDALALIRRHQPKSQFATPQDEADAHEIIRALDGLTLAVETAAIYLGRYAPSVASPEKVMTIPHYVERLRKDLAPSFLDRLEANFNDSRKNETMSQLAEVTSTFQVTFESLSYEARTILGLASLLPSDNIVLDWLQSAASEFHPEFSLEIEAGKSSPWHNLIQLLVSYRLLAPAARPGFFVMHGMLQGACRQILENDIEALETVIIEKMLPVIGSALKDWKNPDIRLQLDVFDSLAKRWTSELFDPSFEIAVHVAAAYRALGEYTKAEALLRYALRFAYLEDGSPIPAAFDIITVLASVLRDTNRALEATELLTGDPQREASSEYSKGKMHPIEPILQTLSGLNDPEQAIELAESFLKTVSDEISSEPKLLDKVISNFAMTGPFLAQQGRTHEAEALMWLALGIAESAYGCDHIKTALPRNNLGQYLCSVSKLPKAEQLLQENVKLLERLGQSSGILAIALYNYGLVLNSLEKPAEACLYHRRALDMGEEVLGAWHPDIALMLAGIASALGKQNKHHEALPYLRRQLIILTKFMRDNDHQHTYFKRAFDDYFDCLLLAGYNVKEATEHIEAAAAEAALTIEKL
jgi:tetratricopeptide (TPR) repeat protein